MEIKTRITFLSIVLGFLVVALIVLGAQIIGFAINVSDMDEVCDGVDNNKDGFVDEGLARCCGNEECDGLQICGGGVWGECMTNEAAPCEDIYWTTVTPENIQNIDMDDDGVPDVIDKCINTVPGRSEWYAQDELKNNHYDSSNWHIVDAYGCSCSQILYCKPGLNRGEFRFGCSAGTKKIWEEQKDDSWALECQRDGKVARKGDGKPIFTNTDGEDKRDIFDSDNDNDGTPDREDDMIDDADSEEDEGYGTPDWWEKRKANENK